MKTLANNHSPTNAYQEQKDLIMPEYSLSPTKARFKHSQTVVRHQDEGEGEGDEEYEFNNQLNNRSNSPAYKSYDDNTPAAREKRQDQELQKFLNEESSM